MKPLNVQRRALRDMVDARAFYLQEAPHMVADLARRLDDALLHIQQYPATGSPRYSLKLGVAGLRSWPVNQFPYVIFYRTENARINVLRVLHQNSDIPAHLQG